MKIDLRGKLALVTGSSKGIGFGVAKVLSGCGTDLILLSRNPINLKKACRMIEEAAGRSPHMIAADLCYEEGRKLAIEKIREIGDPDILFFSIGGPPPGRFEELDMEDWKRAVELLLYPPVFLTLALLPGMKKKEWGRITYLTSVAIKEPIEGLTLSNVVRISTAGLVRDLARDVAPHGITVNGIMPGMIDTERLRELAEERATARGISAEKVLEGFASEIPTGRLGAPEEIGYPAAYLASDYASYTCGSMIPVDGGRLKSSL